MSTRYEGAEPEEMDLDEDLDEDRILEELAWRRHRRSGCLIKITAILVILGMLGITIPQVLLPQLSRMDFPGLNQELLQDEIVKKSEPAVVAISVTKEGGSSSGTGFNIAADGKVVTNLHVVEHASLITVQFVNGTTFHLSGSDYETVEGKDLALLRLYSEKPLPFLQLSRSNRENIRVGQEVSIIGNPQGYERIPQRGQVSATSIAGGSGSEDFMIDIPIHPGNSGSPVIDASGKVIAVVYASVSAERTMALAIPVQYLPREWTQY